MKKTKNDLLKDLEATKKINDKLMDINKKISKLEEERFKIYSELRKKVTNICKCSPQGIYKEKDLNSPNNIISISKFSGFYFNNAEITEELSSRCDSFTKAQKFIEKYYYDENDDRIDGLKLIAEIEGKTKEKIGYVAVLLNKDIKKYNGYKNPPTIENINYIRYGSSNYWYFEKYFNNTMKIGDKESDGAIVLDIKCFNSYNKMRKFLIPIYGKNLSEVSYAEKVLIDKFN